MMCYAVFAWMLMQHQRMIFDCDHCCFDLCCVVTCVVFRGVSLMILLIFLPPKCLLVT